jgi:hypothetical protein
MDPKELQDEITRRRARARELVLDKLIHEIFYKFELMRDWKRYPPLSSGELLDSHSGNETLKVVFHDQEMRLSRRQSDSNVEFLTLAMNGSQVLAFAAAREYHFRSGIITAFIEGPWIEDLKSLHSQMEVVVEKERADWEARRLKEEARKFGISVDQKPSS